MQRHAFKKNKNGKKKNVYVKFTPITPPPSVSHQYIYIHTNMFALGYTELNSGLQGTWVGIHFDSLIKLQALTKRRRKPYAGGLQCLRDTVQPGKIPWVNAVKLILLPRCVHSSQTWKEQQEKRFLKKTVESSRVSAAAASEVQRKTQQCKRRLLCRPSGFTTQRGLGSELHSSRFFLHFRAIPQES